MALEQLGDFKTMSNECQECNGNKITEEVEDYFYNEYENSPSEETNPNNYKVALSTAADNDILIYDNCGRYIPIYYLDVPSLIKSINTYYEFLRVKNEVIVYKNPEEIS